MCRLSLRRLTDSRTVWIIHIVRIVRSGCRLTDSYSVRIIRIINIVRIVQTELTATHRLSRRTVGKCLKLSRLSKKILGGTQARYRASVKKGRKQGRKREEVILLLFLRNSIFFFVVSLMRYPCFYPITGKMDLKVADTR